MSNQYDLIVVGGGPIGLASAYASAKVGKKVLILERFVFANSEGSSGDMARMFRTMYTEDYMADLAYASIQSWSDLSREAGDGNLVWMTGLLNFGDPTYGAGGPEGTLKGPIPNLLRHNMPFEELKKDDIEARYPFRNLPDDYIGLFAPQNGVINVPLLLQTLQRLCIAHGATLRDHAVVDKVSTTPSGATVAVTFSPHGATMGHTEVFTTSKVALTSGAFVNDVLRPSFNVEIDLTIWEMVYSYFTINNDALFPSMWFQFAKDDEPKTEDKAHQPSNLMYGFPALPWALQKDCRIAVDAATRIISNPSERRPEPAPEDIEKVQEFIKNRLPDIQVNPSYSGCCLQTNVFDNMYAFGMVPNTNDCVAVFSAGWAMKMVPLIGSLMDAMLFGHLDTSYPTLAPIVREHFSLTRVDPATKQPLLHPVCDSSRTAIPSSAYVHAPRRIGSSLPLSAAASVGSSKGASKSKGAAAASKPNRFATGSYALSLVKQFKAAHPSIPAPLALFKGSGLPAPQSFTVGIVGGGISGLYAGFILQKLGIKFEILEASSRVGGRVFTHRFSGFKDVPGTPEYYDYFDVGAMRFPVIPTMYRVLGGPEEAAADPDDPSVDRYKYGLVHQLNISRPAGHPAIRFEPYILSDAAETSKVQYNSVTLSRKEITKPPTDQFRFGADNGGDVPKAEISMGSDALLGKVYNDFVHKLSQDFNTGFRALMSVDKHSVRTYMREVMKFSEPAIAWLETVNSATGLFEEAFSESVMDTFDFSGDKWVCISGGTARIVDSIVANITANSGPAAIQSNTVVTRVAPVGPAGMEVIVEPRVSAVSGASAAPKPKSQTKVFSHVILTTTLGALRAMDLKDCNLSYHKRLAMRTMHYDQSVKVGLRFKRRWWQDQTVMKGKAIFGGTSVTDEPVRVVVYPSYGLCLGTPEMPGVLIASYTWAQDAGRIGSMTEDDAVELCLSSLEDLHGPIVREQYSGEHFVYSWHDDPLMNGAFALYGPTQFTELYPGLVAPELNGRLQLAGEAASVHHAWIVGSLNSAYRAVWDILDSTPALKGRQAQMLDEFGRIDEVEYGNLERGMDEWIPGTGSGAKRKAGPGRGAPAKTPDKPSKKKLGAAGPAVEEEEEEEAPPPPRHVRYFNKRLA